MRGGKTKHVPFSWRIAGHLSAERGEKRESAGRESARTIVDLRVNSRIVSARGIVREVSENDADDGATSGESRDCTTIEFGNRRRSGEASIAEKQMRVFFYETLK